MAGRWDSITKILVKTRPAHFSSWLVPFHYRVVKLWEETAQSILDLGWEGLQQTARLADLDTLNILLISVIAAQDEEAMRAVLLGTER